MIGLFGSWLLYKEGIIDMEEIKKVKIEKIIIDDERKFLINENMNNFVILN